MIHNLKISVILIVSLCISCSFPEKGTYYKIAGFAQGTSYHITYQYPDSVNLKSQVDSVLKEFDMLFSLYEPNSLISKVNRNEESLVNTSFVKIYNTARRVWEESDGYFDVTVLPLVNAWGFGPGRKMDVEESIIDSLLQFVGMDKVTLLENQIIKQHPNLQFDFNAIAQGYSVDVMETYFDSLGIKNYMIEIGGEIRTKGMNPSGQLWRIGVDRPDFGNMIPGDQLQVILQMRNKALATSGNYRKFYEEDGVKFSHSINPKTGYPSRDQLLSATVLADDCITADAWATAFMVMGLEKSKAVLETKKEIEAYLIYGDEVGQYRVYTSKGMESFILKEK